MWNKFSHSSYSIERSFLRPTNIFGRVIIKIWALLTARLKVFGKARATKGGGGCGKLGNAQSFPNSIKSWLSLYSPASRTKMCRVLMLPTMWYPRYRFSPLISLIYVDGMIAWREHVSYKLLSYYYESKIPYSLWKVLLRTPLIFTSPGLFYDSQSWLPCWENGFDWMNMNY